ncbi:hypothetical protein C2E21_1370 [Chlorella sorokiniana]|uniref:Uncharacterized protein n=1 Tax=Chlorella sorokiniana TaxID=3076 RepID=A0A2P6U0P1_CHLSO|nr:hypothetical protein C2E21_1370 [Chlorella sorokiniana]|eukprot:PRW59883.1 hypothetical protein C2E21_1370 [Chlorella sorokiniana]
MSASSSSRRSLATRRRSSGAGNKLLGAVKLQSPLGAGSDAGSPCSTASEASALTTPQDRSPLVVSRAAATAPAAAAAPAAADALAQFGHQLASSRSSDRWLEERLASAGGRAGAGHTRRPHASSSSAASPSVVEPVAAQIVHKALRFITGDQTPPPPEGTTPPPKVATAFDSQSFLDKGMDAITGVGKLMEGFALTLDSVIGQAFEEWNTLPSGSSSSSRPQGTGRAAPLPQRHASTAGGISSSSGSALAPRQQQGAAPQAAAAPAGWQDFSIDGKENDSGAAPAPAPAPSSRAAGAKAGSGASTAGGRQAHMTSFMSKLDAASEQEVQEWRKRAQQLASELQRVRAQQEEYQRLRLQYDKLQSELAAAASQATRLAEENSALRSASPAAGPVADPALGPDPLAVQQVARQMEALLSEKSRLVAENDRLLRENTGLQELLEFSLVHQAQWAADGDLFDEPGEEGEGGMALGPHAELAAAEDSSMAAMAAAPASIRAEAHRQQLKQSGLLGVDWRGTPPSLAAGMADPSPQAAQPARQGGQMATSGGARLQAPRGPSRGKRHVRPSGPSVRAGMVHALYACPPLLDALLQRDALRPLSLVVEDVGNPAIALCAHSEDMEAAWRALAVQCDSRMTQDAGLTQVLLAVQRAVLQDPARSQWAMPTQAKALFRLSHRDLDRYGVRFRLKYYSSTGGQNQCYRLLDLLRAARLKHGSAAGLDAAWQRALGPASENASHSKRVKRRTYTLQMELLKRQVEPFENMRQPLAVRFTEGLMSKPVSAAKVADKMAREQAGRVVLPPLQLGSCSTALGGRRALLAAAPRIASLAACGRGRQQRLSVAAVGFGSGNSLKNKYKSRQELEQDYFREWNDMSRAALQEGKQPMTPWTLLAALPRMIRYYVIPAPLRFLVFLVVYVAQLAAHRLRKLAVLTGAKLDVATMQRRGMAGSYRMRQTALRRLHGKESLFGPLQLMMGR